LFKTGANLAKVLSVTPTGQIPHGGILPLTHIFCQGGARMVCISRHVLSPIFTTVEQREPAAEECSRKQKSLPFQETDEIPIKRKTVSFACCQKFKFFDPNFDYLANF
jgi:hypothetical protein